MPETVYPVLLKDESERSVSPIVRTSTIYNGAGNPIGDFVSESELSDQFDTTKAYAKGDYCIKDNTVYKFTAAKPAGAWDSTKVLETKIADEVSLINSNLAALPKIQRGTASGSTGLISVTFDTAFSSTPTVVVSAYGTDSNANNRVAVVRAVSNVGFQAKVSVANTGGDASTSIMWIAVGA